MKINEKNFFVNITFPSMMFANYFPVCIRAVIGHLVPKNDKGMKKNYFFG